MLLKRLKKNRLFKFLASLKLAVILLVALAVILAVATFYESIYDTKTAQYMVYRSPLFAVFLSVLGLNLTCSALIRYPWKKSQTGFVITHLGIILILLGSLVTMFQGIDGSMALQEGETSDKVTIDEPVLYFGRDVNRLKEIPAEYRWNRPEPGKTEHRYQLDGDSLTAVIDDYYHHARSETTYTPSEEGLPALQLRLHNPNVDQSVWLTTADGRLNMGPAGLEFVRLPDQEAVAKFQKPADFEGRGTLQILIEDKPVVVELDRLSDSPYPLDAADASIRLLRYLPHAVVENDELVTRSQDPVNPAVEVELSTPGGKQTWLLFSLLPELNTRTDSSGEKFETRLIYLRDEKSKDRTLEIGLTPEGRLLYRVDGQRTGALAPGESLQTGWMNLEAEVLEFLPVARREKAFHEVHPKKGKEEQAPGPAIRLRLEGAENPGPYWLERGDIRRVPDGKGSEVIIGYGYKTVPIGFDIELTDFRIGYDPGTKNAASYESDVQVGDDKHTIAMNEPLHHNGFTVFQASFADGAGDAMISVFSIAKDPGIGLKYVGSVMLVLGIIIMFYFKPRKTAKVSQARQESGAAQ